MQQENQLWRAQWQSRAVGRPTTAAPKREEVRGDRPEQVGVPFRGLHEILLVDAVDRPDINRAAGGC